MTRARRRKRQTPSQWKKNIIKNARVKGFRYIDHKNNMVPPVETGPGCNCKKQCTVRLQAHTGRIFGLFRSMETKTEQDVYLTSLISCHDVQRRRPRDDEDGLRGPNPHAKFYAYEVSINGTKHKVCVEAFMSFFGVKISRIKRLRILSTNSQRPKELRGSDPASRSNAIPGTTLLLLRRHIESYPVKRSKYAGKPVKYLDARLNVKILHEMFQSKHPNLKVGLTSFRKFFNDQFDLRFGRPQVDVCCTCEEFTIKLKAPSTTATNKQNLEAELKSHKDNAQLFYAEMQRATAEKNNRERDHVLSITFDYMQNVHLPLVPVQDSFYLRQLSVNIFCIHDLKKNVANFYIYHEGVAKKGPNEVTSMLNMYLSSTSVNQENYTVLNLFSDNCGGQNKNHTLSRFCLASTYSGKFERVNEYFPARGHSYLACDRDFALVKHKLKYHDRLYTIDEIKDIILSSSSKFTVKVLETSDVKDFAAWWPDYYKKSCVSEETKGRAVRKEDKVHLKISEVKHASYGGVKGCVVTRKIINSHVRHTFALSNNLNPRPDFTSLRQAYPAGKVPIKPLKIRDISALTAYLPSDFLPFYSELQGWPTLDDAFSSGDESEAEVEE